MTRYVNNQWITLDPIGCPALLYAIPSDIPGAMQYPYTYFVLGPKFDFWDLPCISCS